MSNQILNLLEELKPESGQRLPQATIHRFHSISNSRGEGGKTLVKPELVANGKFVFKLNGSHQTFLKTKNHSVRSKLKAFDASEQGGSLEQLNIALQGGKSYPILSMLSGMVVGYASAGMGLLFSVTSTAVSMSKVSNRVLARPGDQIWKIEELGKVRVGSAYKPVHVLSFFIIDPFRDSSRFQNRGWLIHEERCDVELV